MRGGAIALVDMQMNLVVAMVVLIVGAGVVVFLSRHTAGNVGNARLWISLSSLVAGPVIAFGLWAADVFVLNPDMYPLAFQGDALATLSRIMILGALVGVVAAVVFAVTLRRGRRNDSDASA